jgi:metabotropic X receptor
LTPRGHKHSIKKKERERETFYLIPSIFKEVGELMKAVKRRNATGMFSWIGSDGWGGRGLAYHGKEQQVNMFLFLKIDGIK